MENQTLNTLIKKGVRIPNPGSVLISDDIDPDRISGENVTIHTGCKLFGPQTLIGPDTDIGYETPVTLEDTIVGQNCRLKGGFFKRAVFAGHNEFGSGAHVREGTILEEQASAAHTVGLKQTILFPFVTLGSLINFCDCFMAGGTSRKDHSEVGSSFIHFNYTPNQDKATASMMGDVPNGVMLKSRPIFLGGQGGIVGPVKIAYGCITAAGSIIRKSETKEDRLLLGGALKEMSIPRRPFVYRNVSQIFNSNIQYIAGLIALRSWYRHIRPVFSTDFFEEEVTEGLQRNLDDCINERVKRLEMFCEKLIASKSIIEKKSSSEQLIRSHAEAIDKKQYVAEKFNEQVQSASLSGVGEEFVLAVKKIAQSHQYNYIDTVTNLDQKTRDSGINWLRNIEQSIVTELSI